MTGARRTPRRPPADAGVRAVRGLRPSSFLGRLASGDGYGFAAVQSVVTQAMIVALNLVTGVITARALGADGRGAYAAVSLWPTVLGMAAVAGIGDATLLHLRRRRETSAAGAAAGALIVLAAATALLGVAWLAMPVLLGAEHAASVPLGRLALILTYTTACGALYRQMLAGLGAFGLANLATILPHLLHTLILLALLAAGRVTVLTTVLSAMIAGASTLAFCTPAVLRRLRGELRGVRSAAAGLSGFARRAVWSDLLALATNWSHRLVLIPLLGARELGLYMVAFAFSRVLTIATPSASVLLSALGEASHQDAKALHDLSLRFSLISLGAVVLASQLIGEPLLVFFYGSDFTDAGGVLRLLVVHAALTRVASITGQLYSAVDRPGFNSLSRVLEVAVSIGLMAVLAPRYGGLGAAAAVVAGAVLRLVALWAGIGLYLRLAFPRLWVSRADAQAALGLFR